jgi:cbb3-type cytochrome oxidase maturation protein
LAASRRRTWSKTMSILLMLLPIALFMGLLGLGAFIWALRNGQYEDMEGAAVRAILDDDDDLMPGRKPADGRRRK